MNELTTPAKIDAWEMKLVLQGDYQNCCQQACVAMIANVPLMEIVSAVGSERIGLTEREVLGEKYNFVIDRWGYIVSAVGENCLGAITRKHELVWCNLSSWNDPSFAHVILIYKKEVFDPLYGHNPKWEYDKYISIIHPVVHLYRERLTS